MKRSTISPRELAKQRQVSLDYIYRELWAGKVPGAMKAGKVWRIPAQAANSRGSNSNAASQ